MTKLTALERYYYFGLQGCCCSNCAHQGNECARVDVHNCSGWKESKESEMERKNLLNEVIKEVNNNE